MNMIDPRTPLEAGNTIALNGIAYTIREVVGYGGSCLAYLADKQPSAYERTIGVAVTSTVIKEFYPLELADSQGTVPSIRRNGAELSTTDDERFGELKRRFESGAAEQVAFYGKDCNHALPPATVAAANGTVYSIVSLAQGAVLSEVARTLTLKDKADIITSLCNAAAKLHAERKLYLDIKPSNIFLFGKEPNESRRVALFDFDTVIPIDDIATAVIAYSPDWSPYEQENADGWREKIGFATDIYSIGAVFYWLYTGSKVTPEVLNQIARRRFEFLDDIQDLPKERYLRTEIERVLFATLRRDVSKRAQRVEDILE
jgi:serine/threonine protein kinase